MGDARGGLAPLAAAVFLTALLCAAAATASRPHHRVPKAPTPVNAYPLIAKKGDLASEAANAACSFARSQPRGRRLLILGFGRAFRKGGKFGAGRLPFHSNAEILKALKAAAARYRQPKCHRRGRQAIIAFGLNNYKLSRTANDGEPMSPRMAGAIGTAQARIGRRLAHAQSRLDGVAVAGDLEPGWDPSRRGARVAKALARGADTHEFTYFNFGTAGHCPPFRPHSHCGPWSFQVLGDISQRHKAVPLPEIYYPFQAGQWARVRKRWNHAHDACSKHHERRCYRFAGITSEPKSCGAKLSPARGWRMLWRANPKGSVGRELVFWNPERLSCGGASTRSATQSKAMDPAGYRLLPRTEPGRLVTDPDPLVSADVLSPISNGWRETTHDGVTVVEAGGDAGHPGDGRIVIFRERERPFSQTLDTIRVPGAGTVRLTGAPSQGELGFAGPHGVTGLLHLEDGSITVSSP